MRYNFDEIVPRLGTDCVKYDAAESIFGTSDLIPMWVADMDFRCPPCVTEVLRKRIEHDIFGYTFLSPEWKPAIMNWVGRRYNWQVTEEEIGFVGGIVPAIAFAIQCFSSVGDNILVQPPVYHPYFHVPKDLGRNVLVNPLKLVDGQYSIDFDDFEKKASESRIFILCSPHNPGGRVWNRQELQRMAEICARHNVLVISDEIHCDMTLKGYSHVPFAAVSKVAEENCITFMAASKSFNIAGLKSSYHIIKNKKLREEYSEFLRRSELDFAPLFATATVAAAYNEGEEWLNQMMEYVEENINYMQEYPKTKAIVSGGQWKGEDITEAEAMFQYMVEQGIAPSRIMKEDASKNTRENIANSISLIEKNRENIMIVTNSFHVYRAVEIAKKQGIENPGSLSAPTDKILWLHYHVREVLAVIKYKLSGDI